MGRIDHSSPRLDCGGGGCMDGRANDAVIFCSQPKHGGMRLLPNESSKLLIVLLYFAPHASSVAHSHQIVSVIFKHGLQRQ